MTSKLQEFAMLLQIKNRKEINKWKLDNDYINHNVGGVLNDAMTAYDLLKIEDNQLPITFRGYLKYVDPHHDFDEESVWISQIKKQKFIKDYL